MNAREMLENWFGKDFAETTKDIDWESIADLYKGPANLIEDKTGTQFMEKFIDSDMVNVDMDKRVIILKKNSYFRALTYLTDLHPELESMDPDDNFTVYSMETGELKEIGLLRFDQKNFMKFTFTSGDNEGTTVASIPFSYEKFEHPLVDKLADKLSDELKEKLNLGGYVE